jgi:Lon protease-like protein
LSELLPLFPLPNVVLFPGVFLPLHIFEPRYRAMVADALATDRLIGMVLLRPGWEHDYDGRPPVFSVGCSGLITHCERLHDGRYNIVLRGLDRFRILDEDHSRDYRRGAIQSLIESEVTPDIRGTLRQLRARIESLLAPSEHDAGIDARAAEALSDEDLINALAQYLALEPIEKQALLEQPSSVDRGRALVDLLEMKTLLARAAKSSNLSH